MASVPGNYRDSPETMNWHERMRRGVQNVVMALIRQSGRDFVSIQKWNGGKEAVRDVWSRAFESVKEKRKARTGVKGLYLLFLRTIMVYPVCTANVLRGE
jgi:hypothetical protein